MNLLHALLLGIIEGLTEFIPVSSTAHMLIVQKLLNIPSSNEMFAFLILVQIGPLVALVIYFWKDLWAILVETLQNLGGLGKFNHLPENAKMGWYIIIATLPALLAGVLLKKVVEGLFSQPLLEAMIRLFAAAILLFLAEWLGKKVRGLKSMTWLDALVVGLFQVFAVFPGSSRSGSAISGGMLRGLDRAAATRFAFLMSTPVMLAAGVYEALSLLKLPGLSGFLPVLGVGFVVAGVFGWLSIRWLINYVSKHSLYVFAGYCAAAGLLCVVLQLI